MMKYKKILLTVLVSTVITQLTSSNTAECTHQFFTAIAQQDSNTVAQTIAKRQVDIESLDRNAYTILANNDSLEIQTMLLHMGVRTDARTEQGATPLHTAALVGNTEIIEILINAGANIHAQDSYLHATPLMNAAQSGNMAAVQMLVKYGACLKVKNSWGQTAYALARFYNHTDVAEFLEQEYRKQYPPTIPEDLKKSIQNYQSQQTKYLKRIRNTVFDFWFCIGINIEKRFDFYTRYKHTNRQIKSRL